MDDDRKILGYQPILAPTAGSIQTACLITCCKCDAVISGMGGPRRDALCIPCARLSLDYNLPR